MINTIIWTQQQNKDRKQSWLMAFGTLNDLSFFHKNSHDKKKKKGTTITKNESKLHSWIENKRHERFHIQAKNATNKLENNVCPIPTFVNTEFFVQTRGEQFWSPLPFPSPSPSPVVIHHTTLLRKKISFTTFQIKFTIYFEITGLTKIWTCQMPFWIH